MDVNTIQKIINLIRQRLIKMLTYSLLMSLSKNFKFIDHHHKNTHSFQLLVKIHRKNINKFYCQAIFYLISLFFKLTFVCCLFVPKRFLYNFQKTIRTDYQRKNKLKIIRRWSPYIFQYFSFASSSLNIKKCTSKFSKSLLLDV